MSAALSSIASTPSAGTAKTAGKKSLDTNDFIKLLITQLQNQDPTKPMSNAELLQQVSQIGTLQSQQNLEKTLTDNQNALGDLLSENSDSLSATLTGIMLQNQIGSASNMIGKQVSGLDSTGKNLSGVVTSISVASGVVNLELDSGKTLPMGSVTDISTKAA